MDVTSLVKASAKHVRITELSEGDCYKRINEKYNGVEIKIGVVTTILSNGDDVAITALEFNDNEYEGVVQNQVFKGGDNVALFPALREEVEIAVQGAVRAGHRKVETKQREFNDAKRDLERVSGLAEKVEQGEISDSAFHEIEGA